MRLFEKEQKTLMSGKFHSMLLGGTLTMLVASVLVMSDMIIAGAFVGSDAVAGITLVTPLYSLAAFFGSVFSLGVPIVYSAEMGRFNKDGADKAFGLGLLMSLAVGIVLFILLFLLGDSYLRSSLPSEAVLAEAREYLSWIRFTLLLLPLQMLLAEAVYSDGDESLSSISSAVQGIGNIAFSIILGRIMGVRGIALSSFLFVAVAILILLGHFLKKNNSLRPKLYFSFGMLKDVVRYSIIDASTYLFISIQTVALNVFVNTQYGAKYLILVSVITLIRELQLVFDGIGEAITPIISIYLGEESYDGVSSTYRLAERTAIREGLAVTLLFALCAPLIPGILDITAPELVRSATMGIRIISLASVFVSLLYLLSSYYLLIERIALGFVFCALRDVLLSAPFAILLGKAFGLYGMFAALALAPAVSYALTLAYVSWRYGRENCPLFLGKLRGGMRSELYNLRTEPEEIIDLQHRIEVLLEEEKIDKRTIGRAKLLIEELYMLIREKNGGKAVLSECSVFLRPEGVQIITKDDGIIFDISEEDAAATSLAAFAVSGYMEKLGRDKRHLTTMSFNRSSFLIKKEAV